MSDPLKPRGKPRLSVVIPAYNEADRLPAYLQCVIPYLRSHYPGDHEIVVVDDGSRDATAAEAEKVLAGVGRLVRHPENQGKGAAVRTGMLEARGQWRLFTDADGATPIEELGRLMVAAELGHDVVIGSRTAPGGVRVWTWSGAGEPARSKNPGNEPAIWRVRPHRHYIGRVFARLTNLLVGLPFLDTQCGFKLFHAPAAESIFPRIQSHRYAFDVEALALAAQMGMRIAEVPVSWHEVPGSKVSLLSDSPQMFRELLRIRALRSTPSQTRSLPPPRRKAG